MLYHLRVTVRLVSRPSACLFAQPAPPPLPATPCPAVACITAGCLQPAGMEVKTISADAVFRVFTACPTDPRTLILDVR